MEAHVLRERGWTIAAIARHLNRDRKTIRAYLNGERVPGQRRSSGEEVFAEFEAYCRVRFRQDPHLQATTLYDELVELGYAGSYRSLTRAIRDRKLRPYCERCQSIAERDVAIIEHEPGGETRWDWVDLPNPPEHWDWPHKQAHLLVGSLPYSGRWRGWLSPLTDQPHLIVGLHEVCARLGGLTLGWRFDRMSTVYDRAADDINTAFAQAAKFYGVTVEVCPGGQPQGQCGEVQ